MSLYKACHCLSLTRNKNTKYLCVYWLHNHTMSVQSKHTRYQQSKKYCEHETTTTTTTGTITTREIIQKQWNSQYLCTVTKQVKHKVAGVGYVTGDNSLVLAVSIEMKTSVSVHYQSKAWSHVDPLPVQHWPLNAVLQDRVVWKQRTLHQRVNKRSITWSS